jgi:xylulose-5-phosphate/fructose-6-phosphate phosphoketolase
VVVAGKQPQPNLLNVDQTTLHMTRGLGIFDWAGSEVEGEEPDVVLAAAGDIPTLEVLAASEILQANVPELKVRVVNVVDLMKLQPANEHPHGLSDVDYDAIFTTDKPVIFAYHGYPWLIHRLTYRRNGHGMLHVRGYKEQGSTTTPFDMVMRNDLDRYHLVIDAIDRVPGLSQRYASLRQKMLDARLTARLYAYEHGEDIPEVAQWSWKGGAEASINDTGGDNE